MDSPTFRGSGIQLEVLSALIDQEIYTYHELTSIRLNCFANKDTLLQREVRMRGHPCIVNFLLPGSDSGLQINGTCMRTFIRNTIVFARTWDGKLGNKMREDNQKTLRLVKEAQDPQILLDRLLRKMLGDNAGRTSAQGLLTRMTLPPLPRVVTRAGQPTRSISHTHAEAHLTDTEHSDTTEGAGYDSDFD